MRALDLQDAEVEAVLHAVLAADDPGVYRPLPVPRTLTAARGTGPSGVGCRCAMRVFFWIVMLDKGREDQQPGKTRQKPQFSA